jgi:hypothetical protein
MLDPTSDPEDFKLTKMRSMPPSGWGGILRRG